MLLVLSEFMYNLISYFDPNSPIHTNSHEDSSVDFTYRLYGKHLWFQNSANTQQLTVYTCIYVCIYVYM